MQTIHIVTYRPKPSMTHRITFQLTCLIGVEAMDAVSARSFPRHTHDQYGIGMIDHGAQASVSDSRQVEAGPGNLIFVNPGEVHDGRAIGDGPRAWRMLYFPPDLLRAAQDDVLDGMDADLTFPAPVGVDEALTNLFNTLYARATQPEFDLGLMACESSALALVAHLGRRLVRTPYSASASRAALRKITDRIDANPGVPMTLAELAREAGISRYQLHRKFVRAVGLPPHAYILQQRIALARRLIREGTPLADAALETGFYDQSHLNRCFGRTFGVSPMRYAVPSAVPAHIRPRPG